MNHSVNFQCCCCCCTLNNYSNADFYYNNKQRKIHTIIIHINLQLVLTLLSIQNFIILPNDPFQYQSELKWGEEEARSSFHDMATSMIERLNLDGKEWRSKIDGRQQKDLFTHADVLQCKNYYQGQSFPQRL